MQQMEEFIPLVIELKKKIEIIENQNTELKQKVKILEEKIENISKIMEQNQEKQMKQTPCNKLFKSNIIDDNDEKVIMNWIPNKINSTELIFDTARDGDSIKAFEERCKGQSPTLVIVKTTIGIIFGGYATSDWKEKGPIEDYNSFVFSLNPQKKYNVTYPQNALYGYRYNDIMFQFGCCCFRIAPNCTKNNDSYINEGYYEKGLIDLIKGDHKFKVNRLEIFRVNF